MKLHSLTSFRAIIKKNAKQEKIALTNKNEPGSVATIKGKLTARYPVENLLVYVYQTDNKGWYADTGAHVFLREGDRGHARLFGYLRSDKNGKFEFNTIHPQGYPKSDLPQHIHLEVFDSNGRSLIITELLFDDDARLVGETRSSSLRNGYLVAKNEGKGGVQVYSYTISLR
jgi:protocatechuate 3,4-dioxygenase beta subunit